MVNTIAEIFDRVATLALQEADGPTAGSDEWNLWLGFLNRSVSEWAQAHDWEELRKPFVPSISGISTVTVSLPEDFRKLAATPILWGDVEEGEEYPEIPPERQTLYSTDDKWTQVLGNTSAGYDLIWNPGLESGASVTIQYFSIPTSLASPTQTPLVPDSGFLVDRITSFIWEARSDPRFQQVEVRAREKLLQLIENSNVAKYSSYGGSAPVIGYLRKQNFRMGRD